MAEHVQAALDQMVVPLRDLLDRQIFSHDEIKSVVDRRRQSEYLLRRLTARKADFLRYIEAEQLLERLRQLRVKQRKRDHRKKQRQDEKDGKNAVDQQQQQEQQHPGDVHIVQHIHLLFARAIRKFRSDLSLHLAHAEFCKETRSWTKLGKCYSEAIQIFPHSTGLWIEYASHEFFGPTRSIRNARIILQRALRMNQNALSNKQHRLWLEYFALEMHYAQTLKGRRQILQLQLSQSASRKTKKNTGSDDDDDDDNDDDEQVDIMIGFDGKPIVGGQDGDGTDQTAYDDYKIPIIVYRNAIKAVPNNIQFRLQFMDKCKQFPATKPIMDVIVDSIGADFGSKEPESWIARAFYEAELSRENKEQEDIHEPSKKRQKTKTSKVDRVITVLEEAIETIQTDDMFLSAFRFAKNYKADLEQRVEVDETNEELDTKKKIDSVNKYINKLLDAMSDHGYTSTELALEHTNYLLDNGYHEQAAQTIQKFCMNSASRMHQQDKASNAHVWIRWATLQVNLEEQIKILERAISIIPMTQSPDHFVLLLQLFGLQIMQAKHAEEEGTEDNDDDEMENRHNLLFDSLQRLILLSPKTNDDGDAAAEIVENLVGSSDIGSFNFDGSQYMNVYDAAVALMKLLTAKEGLQGVRKVYQLVLLRSTVQLSESNVNSIQTLIDQCLKLETDRAWKLRLYDKAIDIFDGSPIQEQYRFDRNEKAVFAT